MNHLHLQLGEENQENCIYQLHGLHVEVGVQRSVLQSECILPQSRTCYVHSDIDDDLPTVQYCKLEALSIRLEL